MKCEYALWLPMTQNFAPFLGQTEISIVANFLPFFDKCLGIVQVVGNWCFRFHGFLF
jgi:hypothetical protein